MASIHVNNISKRFGSTQAVDGVSFDVQPGEIFGLLGPNGAGKTTTIRIILDIFKPDSGTVEVLGGKMNEQKKNLIGYLPEERGLYQDIPVERCLQFMAQLKGMNKQVADDRIQSMLNDFDLSDSRKKKVKELSKGMQQKAQLITTLVHEPQLIIIDEPFSSLDPVNTQMVKDLLISERNKGKAVVMCTHQMAQVEQLCDRLVLIDKGKVVLQGSLDDIRKQFTSRDVLIRTNTELPSGIKDIIQVEPHNGRQKLILSENTTPQQILKQLVDSGVQLEEFEIAVPSLDEIFVQSVSTKGN
ncbi:MAG: ATP-binding cassette domain-containing protein [Anaerolineaceae bacterium]|nr:ATP-binding cassette domain-containing protein [Anaerolineaceae bacterium]